MSLSEELIRTTTRIECGGPGWHGTGTGFFFNFCKSGDVSIPAIVTNRHVVRGATSMTFLVNVSDESGKNSGERLTVRASDAEHQWIPHPNPDVDLCILPIAPMQRFCPPGHRLSFKAFDASNIPSHDEIDKLSYIDEVTMIGYPNGLWDEVNNLPIVRRGITATPYRFDYQGRSEFVIDSACYPGSSGSPVMIYNEGAFASAGGITLGSRLHLLGVLYSGPVRDVEGRIVMSTGPRVLTRDMLNLGYVIKASRLLEFEPVLSALATQGEIGEVPSDETVERGADKDGMSA